MVSSARRFALMHELRGRAEPSVEELIRHMTPVDLLLIEGFKAHAHDKLEVHRPSVGKPLLCRGDRRVVALASDGKVAGVDLPQFHLDDVPAIAGFIIAHCGLAGRA
jgi:molybdopterin-guanine dinucleotide biosynthesis protein B